MIGVHIMAKRAGCKPRRLRQIIVETRYTSNPLPANQLTDGGPHYAESERFDSWLEKRLIGAAS